MDSDEKTQTKEKMDREVNITMEEKKPLYMGLYRLQMLEGLTIKKELSLKKIGKRGPG